MKIWGKNIGKFGQIYPTTLVVSTLIILFSEMFIFLQNNQISTMFEGKYSNHQNENSKFN